MKASVSIDRKEEKEKNITDENLYTMFIIQGEWKGCKLRRVY